MENNGCDMTISPEQLLSNLRWRYATKKFDSLQKIPDEVWQCIESSLILTPSSFGLQPWKFFVVKDPAIRAALLPESWNQNQVIDASHFVVLTARNDLDANDIQAWIECLAETQNCSLESLAPYRGMVEGTATALSIHDRAQWNTRQVYIALGQLMATAATLGIDSCPMEGINFATAFS